METPEVVVMGAVCEGMPGEWDLTFLTLRLQWGSVLLQGHRGHQGDASRGMMCWIPGAAQVAGCPQPPDPGPQLCPGASASPGCPCVQPCPLPWRASRAGLRACMLCMLPAMLCLSLQERDSGCGHGSFSSLWSWGCSARSKSFVSPSCAPCAPGLALFVSSARLHAQPPSLSCPASSSGCP